VFPDLGIAMSASPTAQAGVVAVIRVGETDAIFGHAAPLGLSR
jgi:hypothetical protein